MGKRKLNLPPYRLSQELWNAISHGLGAVLALIGGGFLIDKADKACRSSDWVGIMSACIYVVGVFLMFLMSCLYHSLAKNRGKKVLRVLDHDFVFLPIMGTYTPYCLVGLHTVPGQSFPWGYVILAIVYAGCITGIALNSVSLRKFNTVVVALYVILGSTIVLAFYPLILALKWEAVVLLASGGVAYWIGAVLYGLGGKKNLWFHTVFHFFVLAGAILMFFSLYFYVY